MKKQFVVIAVILVVLFGIQWLYFWYKESQPDHFISYLAVTNRDDIYVFDKNANIAYVDLSTMKRDGKNSKFVFYDTYKKQLCAKKNFLGETPINSCQSIKIGGINFTYRDFYNPIGKFHRRTYFYKDRNQIVKIKVLFNNKPDNKKTNQSIETYLNNLSLFWKVNNPLSAYSNALYELVQWKLTYTHQALNDATVPVELKNRLQEASQELQLAIQKASTQFPKDPVIHEFIKQYIELITNTNKTLLDERVKQLKPWYLDQEKKLNSKRNVLLALLAPKKDKAYADADD